MVHRFRQDVWKTKKYGAKAKNMQFCSRKRAFSGSKRITTFISRFQSFLNFQLSALSSASASVSPSLSNRSIISGSGKIWQFFRRTRTKRSRSPHRISESRDLGGSLCILPHCLWLVSGLGKSCLLGVAYTIFPFNQKHVRFNVWFTLYLSLVESWVPHFVYLLSSVTPPSLLIIMIAVYKWKFTVTLPLLMCLLPYSSLPWYWHFLTAYSSPKKKDR
jgi:hypothetical protein